MKARSKNMSRCGMISATEISKRQCAEYIAHAEKLKNDPDRKERLEKCECVTCFYGSRWGGSAITSRECGGCGVEMVFSSTATDALCKDCAAKHDLCRRCGGDIQLRIRRKDWPAFEGVK